MDTQNIYHGWYSKKQKKIIDNITYNDGKQHPISNIYLDKYGNEVEVTMVSQEKYHRANKYYLDDIEYKGLLTKWIRSIY